MDRTEGAPRGAGLVLGLLLLAYIFNFLDRTILNILAGSIIKDLKLTDTEFGAITGLAFAILYSVLGVPLALLADRTRIRAQLDEDCPALDFYGGFYLQPDDDRLCAHRDAIHSRMGGSCTIERFRQLEPRLRH